uniref:Amphoterin-induced protein 3 n=1 Tax=Ornithorhynchus anatinus TaxID=9258 RepID=A0A6I8PD73_ORNAN
MAGPVSAPRQPVGARRPGGRRSGQRRAKPTGRRRSPPGKRHCPRPGAPGGAGAPEHSHLSPRPGPAARPPSVAPRDRGTVPTEGERVPSRARAPPRSRGPRSSSGRGGPGPAPRASPAPGGRMGPRAPVRTLWRCLGRLLVFLELSARGSAIPDSPHALHRCPPVCICTADLLSCARRGLVEAPAPLPAVATALDLSYNALPRLQDHWLAGLPRLQTLRLGHNQISGLSPRAFHNATSLRHLDLSSNALSAVRKRDFEELVNLEELLLYDNRIARVEEHAFRRLGRLRKVYLSWNRLTAFPFRALRGLAHPRLRALDLSTNRLSGIPIEEVAALPVYVKNGLYLHNNPIRCSCPLYRMFRHWQRRGFSSVADFADEHVCVAFEVPSSRVRFFAHGKIFENCSAGDARDLPERHLRVTVGQPLTIDCDAGPRGAPARYLWISPGNEFIDASGSRDRTMAVRPNGSLAIRRVQMEHSGVYVCLAVGRHQRHNQTHEFNVTVQYPRHEAESFNTGLTTLLGCVVSLVLVLLYLYLTPCRCSSCCRRPLLPGPPQERSAQSSILSATPPATDGPNRKIGANKHVVFLEPIKEVQNGRVKPAVSEDPDLRNPKILQLKSDSESGSSVFSDTPIVI